MPWNNDKRPYPHYEILLGKQNKTIKPNGYIDTLYIFPIFYLFGTILALSDIKRFVKTFRGGMKYEKEIRTESLPCNTQPG